MWLKQDGEDGGLLNTTWIKTLFIDDDNWIVVQLHGCKMTRLIEFDSREKAQNYINELAELISTKDTVIKID